MIETRANPDGTITIRISQDTESGFRVIEEHLTVDAAQDHEAQIRSARLIAATNVFDTQSASTVEHNADNW